jgi:hypothetical protein
VTASAEHKALFARSCSRIQLQMSISLVSCVVCKNKEDDLQITLMQPKRSSGLDLSHDGSLQTRQCVIPNHASSTQIIGQDVPTEPRVGVARHFPLAVFFLAFSFSSMLVACWDGALAWNRTGNSAICGVYWRFHALHTPPLNMTAKRSKHKQLRGPRHGDIRPWSTLCS